MTFSGQLYIGDKIKDSADELKKNCIGFAVNGYKKEYIIILSFNPDNLLELIPVKELRHPYYQENDFKVVGVAADKEEAKTLTARIIEDVYKMRGCLDVAGFFDT